MQKFVSYLRVSTQRQGRSGLGLEAQRALVSGIIGEGDLLHEYIEVESGKNVNRLQLEKAEAHAKMTNSILIIAKPDRLGRRASHVLSFLDRSTVKIVFADNPDASDLELGIKSIIAQEEGVAISSRTKAALAAKRARGETLGTPANVRFLNSYISEHGNEAAVVGIKAAADAFAQNIAFAVQDVISQGHETPTAIAAELNARGFETRRGSAWTYKQVQRVVERLAA